MQCQVLDVKCLPLGEGLLIATFTQEESEVWRGYGIRPRSKITGTGLQTSSMAPRETVLTCLALTRKLQPGACHRPTLRTRRAAQGLNENCMQRHPVHRWSVPHSCLCSQIHAFLPLEYRTVDITVASTPFLKQNSRRVSL